MQTIAFLHPTANDPEIAILRLSNQEHDDLHKGPKDWVNQNKVFPKSVNSVEMLPHASIGPKGKGTGWIVAFYHYPQCAVIGSCVQV
jgi:hypothetical protein